MNIIQEYDVTSCINIFINNEIHEPKRISDREHFAIIIISQRKLMQMTCSFMCGTEKGLGSGFRNRVARMAAGYNVVSVRESGRRFKFSQYPDSKNIPAKFPHFFFHHHFWHMLLETINFISRFLLPSVTSFCVAPPIRRNAPCRMLLF